MATLRVSILIFCAALYETSIDGTVFISVSNESEFGLHYDVGDALAEADILAIKADLRRTSALYVSVPNLTSCVFGLC